MQNKVPVYLLSTPLAHQQENATKRLRDAMRVRRKDRITCTANSSFSIIALINELQLIKLSYNKTINLSSGNNMR